MITVGMVSHPLVLSPGRGDTSDGPVTLAVQQSIDYPLFLCSKTFDADWLAAGLDDVDLKRLQANLGTDPMAGDVMPGTDGLRKIRFARPGKGKSGGVRVCYAYFPAFGVIHLYIVFKKNEKANLTQSERNAVAVALANLNRLLTERKERQEAAKAGSNHSKEK